MLATLKLEPRTITPEPLTIHSFTLTTIILLPATSIELSGTLTILETHV